MDLGSSNSNGFLLLAMFSHFTFRLTEEYVALALHCCLGGNSLGFLVHRAYDFGFQFSIAAKFIGFSAYALRRVMTKGVTIHFHLWRDGGPN